MVSGEWKQRKGKQMSKSKKSQKSKSSKQTKKAVKTTSSPSTPSVPKVRGPVPEKKPFILAQPRSMSAKAVVALGKKRGMKVSENYVHVVRKAEKVRLGGSYGKKPGVIAHKAVKAAKKIVAENVQPAKAGKKVGKVVKGHPDFGAKKAFVLSQPFDMKPKHVLEAAKKIGLVISYNYVGLVRSEAKGAKRPVGRPVTLVPEGHGSNGSPKINGSAASPSELQLRRLIFQVGIARSRDVMAEVVRVVESL
jgi:hypothetical protein